VFEPILQARAGEWLDRQAGGEILVAVAELDGVAVRRIAIDYTRHADRGAAHVWSAHVDAGHRSRGIGSALISHVEAAAEARGLETVEISVGKENDRARALYERLGYRCYGEDVAAWSYVEDGRTVHQAEPVWLLRKALRRS